MNRFRTALVWLAIVAHAFILASAVVASDGPMVFAAAILVWLSLIYAEVRPRPWPTVRRDGSAAPVSLDPLPEGAECPPQVNLGIRWSMQNAHQLATSQPRSILETLAGFRPLVAPGQYLLGTTPRTLGGIPVPPNAWVAEAAGLALALLDGTPHPLRESIHREGLETDLQSERFALRKAAPAVPATSE